MSHIIDRRLNGKNKNAVNRQRFMRRYRSHIEKAVTRAIGKRSIQDMDRGEAVNIPARDVSEPNFSHGTGGKRSIVHPGNKEFVEGDQIQKPDGGGRASSSASDTGEGSDDFVFQLTREEFMDYMFEDLELPNMVKCSLQGDDAFKYVNAGYSNDGVPAKLSVVRSLKTAKARRIALTGKSRKRLRECEEEKRTAESAGDELKQRALSNEIRELEAKIRRVPYLDTYDLRFKLHNKQPVPTSKAVMICLMDISGSMTQQIKDLAKRYFLLLYLFLSKSYEKTEIVFIRHHTSAKEVDEEEFFYSRETGGTIVSSALKLALDVVKERYPVDDWNIYFAQASDGDNWGDDSSLCRTLLNEQLLPLAQYYTYIEITAGEHQSLWDEYLKLEELHPEKFAQRQITDASDIYPIFRELFEKKTAS